MLLAALRDQRLPMETADLTGIERTRLSPGGVLSRALTSVTTVHSRRQR